MLSNNETNLAALRLDLVVRVMVGAKTTSLRGSAERCKKTQDYIRLSIAKNKKEKKKQQIEIKVMHPPQAAYKQRHNLPGITSQCDTQPSQFAIHCNMCLSCVKHMYVFAIPEL